MKKLVILPLILFTIHAIAQKTSVPTHQNDFPAVPEQTLEIEKPLYEEEPLQLLKAELELAKGFDLELSKTISSKTANHYHYHLTFNNIKVYGMDIHAVVSYNGTLRRVITGALPLAPIVEDFPLAQAEQLRAQEGAESIIEDEMVWIVNNNRLVPARKVELVSENRLHEDLIYNQEGILYTIDKIKRHHASGPNDTTVQGYIFEPDPLTTAQVNYGTPYVDNNDSEVGVLNAERKWKSFTATYTPATGIFTLRNDFVQVTDVDAPNTVVATSTSGQFSFTRGQSGFEDVNCIYHISNHKQHMDALGFNNIPGYTILIDPHALNGTDNSLFSSASNPRILMGEGGVDDAEDADVIVHEYTHAYILAASGNNNGSTERNTIEESLGDYFAASYSRSISNFNKERVFSWDGHNPFWAGRMVESIKNYKTLSFNGNIYAHTDIFASALMEIYGILGRNTTDEIVMEAIFSLGQSTTMSQMAMHIVQADADLNGGVNYQVIVDAFIRRSILDQSMGFGEGLAASDNLRILATDQFAEGGNLQVESAEPIITAYTLYTLSGKPLETKNLNQATDRLSLSGDYLTVGMYVLKIDLTNGQSASYKVVRY